MARVGEGGTSQEAGRGQGSEGKLGGLSGASVVANATINKYEIKI